MLRRVSHELGGLGERLSRVAEQVDQEGRLTQESWRDQRGEAFVREHVFPFKANVAQLVASVDETRELFEEITKRLSDPDPSQ